MRLFRDGRPYNVESYDRLELEVRMTPERLDAFFACWNRREYDELVAFLTPDCVFHASVGNEPLGRTVRGRDGIRKLAGGIWDIHRDGRYVDIRSFVASDRGASEWAVEWPGEDGATQRIAGCDLFEFEGDLIKVINGFRKLAT
jgi:nuclear transport factor 2 (NTF2) superfamily protein